MTAAEKPDGRKVFMVYLNGAQDPMGEIYQQPIRASKVEVVDRYLTFFLSDGTLSALFHLSAVRNWREVVLYWLRSTVRFRELIRSWRNRAYSILVFFQQIYDLLQFVGPPNVFVFLQHVPGVV